MLRSYIKYILLNQIKWLSSWAWRTFHFISDACIYYNLTYLTLIKRERMYFFLKMEL